MVKTMGKGSLSSALRVAMEAAWYLTILLTALVLIEAVRATAGEAGEALVDLPLSFELDTAGHSVSSETIPIVAARVLETRGKLRLRSTSRRFAVLWLGAATLLVGAWLVIIYQLREFVKTLAAGEPFARSNALRLRVIGLFIVGFELARFGIVLGISLMLKANVSVTGLAIETELRPNLVSLFVGLLVLVVGEAFRRAAEIQEEQALTV
jgi:hypothetical protein